MTRKFNKSLVKILAGKTFYIVVIIFLLGNLDLLFQYYSSGVFNDETFRKTFMTGWIKWVTWFGILLAITSGIVLMIQTCLSDLSLPKKLGVLMVFFGFVLSFALIALIDLIGFSGPLESRVILIMCYVNLLFFAVGTGLLKARGNILS